jgi:hypothetical protein
MHVLGLAMTALWRSVLSSAILPAGGETSDPTCVSHMEHESSNAKISSATACERPYQKDPFAIEAALALKTYVGSAKVSFAIAVYFTFAENGDNHARLSRNSR